MPSQMRCHEMDQLERFKFAETCKAGLKFAGNSMRPVNVTDESGNFGCHQCDPLRIRLPSFRLKAPAGSCEPKISPENFRSSACLIQAIASVFKVDEFTRDKLLSGD